MPYIIWFYIGTALGGVLGFLFCAALRDKDDRSNDD